MNHALCIADVPPRRDSLPIVVDDAAKAFGERLREAYENAGFNRNAFSRQIGAYYHQVLRWEDGQIPKPETLAKIAEVCGVTVDWLLRGGAVVDREDVPGSLLLWESKLAPKSYDPKRNRPRLLATKFRFPPDEAYKWGQVWSLALDEIAGRGQTEAGRAETEAAKKEGDALGLRPLPSKPPKKARR